MAPRKLKPAASAADTADASNALEILHPERSVTIAGREIVVREYGFVESMRLHGLIQPILDDLRAMVVAAGVPRLDDVMGVMARHDEAIVQLLARSADVEPDWVAGLSAADGEHLLYLWWGVNGPFWLGGVVQRIAAERAAERIAARVGTSLAGPISMPPSSPPDTATSMQ